MVMRRESQRYAYSPSSNPFAESESPTSAPQRSAPFIRVQTQPNQSEDTVASLNVCEHQHTVVDDLLEPAHAPVQPHGIQVLLRQEEPLLTKLLGLIAIFKSRLTEQQKNRNDTKDYPSSSARPASTW